MPVGGGTVYVNWEVTVYTLTIVNGEATTVVNFGVEYANGIDATVADLAYVLEDNLPEATEEYTYAWAEAVPEAFELQNYTFTVAATKVEYTYTFIINRMDRVNGIVTVTSAWGEALTAPVPEAVAGKTFNGWIDVEENAVTVPETMPVGGGAVYATWNVTVYTLTIVNGETTETINFAVEYTNEIEVAVTDLANVLEDKLPANTEDYTYAWAEEIPETFELQNYTFTVVATEVEDEQPTPPDDDPVTPPVDNDPTEEPKEEKGGCGSSIVGIGAAVTLLGAAVVVAMKKKED